MKIRGLAKLTTMLCAVLLASCGGGSGRNDSDVSVTGTMDAVQLTPQNSATFHMTVANVGGFDLTNVSVTNETTVPLVQDTIACTASGGAVCPATLLNPMTVPSLPKGGSLVFDITAHLTPHGAAGSVQVSDTMRASVSGDADTSNNVASVVTTALYSQAAVTVTGVGPTDTVAGGGTATFVMTISNAGPDPATNLSIKDVPQTLQVPAITCQGTGAAVCPTTLSAHGDKMTVDTLNPGDTLVFTVTGLAPSSPRGQLVTIGNKMDVTLDNDTDNSDNSASVQANAYTALSGVFVTGVGPVAMVPSGTPASYTMTVQNAGPDAATNVHIVDQVDSAQTYSGISCQATGGAVCPADDQLGPVMDVASIPANGTLVFTVGTTVKGGYTGTIRNTMTATPDNDPNRTDNTATASGTAGGQDVAVTMTAPAGPVSSGLSITFTATVTNNGPSAAQNVTLTDTVGTNLTLGTITCTATGGAICPSATGATMTVPSLPVGGVLNLSIQAAVTAGASGQVTNTLAASDAGESKPLDNTATAGVLAVSSDLAVSQTAPTSAGPGTTANFVAVVSNPGPNQATNISVTQSLLPNTLGAPTVTCAPVALCPAAPLGQQLTIPMLKAGQAVSLTYAVQIPGGNHDPVTSTVVISAAGDSNTANNIATNTVQLVDARSGDYTLFSTDGKQYTLSIDFDKSQYTISGNGRSWNASFTASGNGDYVVAGTARLRVATDLIVGSDATLGGTGTPMPYIAARNFVTSLLQAQGAYDLATRNIRSGTPGTHAGTASVSNNILSVCQANASWTASATNVWRTPNCKVPLVNYAVTQSGNAFIAVNTDPNVTEVYNFYIARSGALTLLISAGVAADGSQQFRVGVPDSASIAGGSPSGPDTNGDWITMLISSGTYGFTGVNASNGSISMTPVITQPSTVNFGPFSMVVTTTGAPMWLLQGYPLSVVVGDTLGGVDGLIQLALP